MYSMHGYGSFASICMQASRVVAMSQLEKHIATSAASPSKSLVIVDDNMYYRCFILSTVVLIHASTNPCWCSHLCLCLSRKSTMFSFAACSSICSALLQHLHASDLLLYGCFIYATVGTLWSWPMNSAAGACGMSVCNWHASTKQPTYSCMSSVLWR